MVNLKSFFLRYRPAFLLLFILVVGCKDSEEGAATDFGAVTDDGTGPDDGTGANDGAGSDDGTGSDDRTGSDDGTGADDRTGADDGTATDVWIPTTPTVQSSTPVDGATGVPINASISATFTEVMDPTTLDAATFTLTYGATAIPVPGTVIPAHSAVVFWPAAQLASNVTFTATITTGASSASDVALAADHAWSFTTGDAVAFELPVNLGTAGNYVILAKSGISTVPTSAITGNLGISPAAATFITGFSLTADSTNVFSTTPQVTGKVYAADYAPPTPSNLTTAIGDMELAFTDAAGRAPDVTELGAGDIGGMTLPPGVYKWGTGLLVPADVTLVGSETDVWIFQIAQDLTMSSAVKILLAGGALPRNIFWQVAGFVDLGTTAHCEGVILTQTAITMRTGASINGRLLAQTAVDIDGSTVVEPAH